MGKKIIRVKTGTILSTDNLKSLANVAINNTSNDGCKYTITIRFEHDIIFKSDSLEIFNNAVFYENKIKEFEFYSYDVETSIYFTLNRSVMFNSIYIESSNQDKSNSIYLQYKELIKSFDRRIIVLRRPLFNVIYSFIFLTPILYSKDLVSKNIVVIPTIIIFATSFWAMKILLPEIKFDTCKTNIKGVGGLLWILGSVIILIILIFVSIYIGKYWHVS